MSPQVLCGHVMLATYEPSSPLIELCQYYFIDPISLVFTCYILSYLESAIYFPLFIHSHQYRRLTPPIEGTRRTDNLSVVYNIREPSKTRNYCTLNAR